MKKLALRVVISVEVHWLSGLVVCEGGEERGESLQSSGDQQCLVTKISLFSGHCIKFQGIVNEKNTPEVLQPTHNTKEDFLG